jgi:hypothetical protein
MGITKQQLIGLLGSLLLLIGVFLPVLSVPIMGSISLLNNGRSDGTIILGLAIASSALIFMHKIKLLWATGGISIALLSYDLYMVSSKISQTKAELTEKMQGNPFGGFADAMMSSVQLQFGWVVLFLGCILLLVTPMLENGGFNGFNFKISIKREDSTSAVNNLESVEDGKQPESFIKKTNIKVVGDSFYHNSKDQEEVEIKPCPFCAESIRMTAIKCKYCGSMLDE